MVGSGSVGAVGVVVVGTELAGAATALVGAVVAWSEVNAAFVGIRSPIWPSSCDHAYRVSARLRTWASWASREASVETSALKRAAAACQLATAEFTLA